MSKSWKKCPFSRPQDLTFGQGRNQTKFGFSPASFTENLTKFETEPEVQNASGFPHVISVVESERIACSFKVKDSDYTAGDIVLWDGEKKVVADPNGFSLPTSGYTPVGVVIIPASHMDDGKARMMSTRWMSCDDPENGSVVPEMMVWGSATETSGLTYFTQVPAIARYEDESTGERVELTVPQAIYTNEATYSNLPSNYPTYSGETNPEDPGTKWYQSGTFWKNSEHTVKSSSNYYSPSPYTKNGTPNSLYRATEYSGGSLNNALSYFDGRKQTDAILEARGEKDYSSWKPDSGTPEDFPVVSCCDIYHTVGTNQGDWYLPSQAELGYVVARLDNINSSITKIGGMLGLATSWSWSSTVFSSDITRTVAFFQGLMNQFTLKNIMIAPAVAFTTV